MTEYMSFDTETTGFNIFHGARPFMFIGSKMTNAKLKTLCSKNGERFRTALEDPSITKIMHNGKFDLLMMRSIGIEVQGTIYDTMIAAHLLDENNSCSLAYCATHYLGERKQKNEIDAWFTSQKIKKADRNYADIPDEIIIPYAIADAELTYKLFFALKPLLIADGLWDLFEQECSLIPVLADMFCEGLKVDIDYFKTLKHRFVERALLLQGKLYQIAGEEFNIGSSKQLANVLIADGVILPLTPAGNYSCKKAVLEELDHPLVKDVLEYRRTIKFVSTFMDAMLTKNVDSIIHCELWAQGTVTGRFSSSEPNLQNILKPKKDKEGNFKNDTDSIRRGFVCKPDYYMFYFDYAQQEYRVFLDYIKEEEMVRLVNEEQADYHDLVYDDMKDVLEDRDQTKTFNFMLIYGGGALAMVKKMGISATVEEVDELEKHLANDIMPDHIKSAKRYIDFINSKQQVHTTVTNELLIKTAKALDIKERYFAKFTKVQPFFKLAIKTRNFRGYVTNKFGRRLHSEKPYTAVNHLIQGSCADFIKNRMVEVHKFLVPYKSSLVLQIHDELVVDMHKDELHLVPKIKSIMEQSHNWFKVNLDVDVEWTKTNWADKEAYERDK